MYGSFNPLQSIPLTVVTPQLVIQGSLQTRLRRLTDVLNEPNMSHLILADATFMEVGSRRVVAGPAVTQVQLSDVLFVHSSGPTESGQEQRSPKQAVRAVILATPYTIEGQIHLPYESELQQALDAFESGFFPVSSARYWSYSVAESPNYVDLLVVNHSRAHVAIPAGAEWQREAPPVSGSSGGSDVW
jgi:hypothetical protein